MPRRIITKGPVGKLRRRGDAEAALIISVVAVGICLVCLIVIGFFGSTVLNNRQDLLNQREGRRQAISAICAGTRGVINAGEYVLRQSGADESLIQGYRQRIIDEVQREAKRSDLEVVPLDAHGNLDCKKYLQVGEAE